jgi:hypothetical protein
MLENDSVKSNAEFRQEAVHVFAVQTVSDLLGHSIHELNHIERRLKKVNVRIWRVIRLLGLLLEMTRCQRQTRV